MDAKEGVIKPNQKYLVVLWNVSIINTTRKKGVQKWRTAEQPEGQKIYKRWQNHPFVIFLKSYQKKCPQKNLNFALSLITFPYSANSSRSSLKLHRYQWYRSVIKSDLIVFQRPFFWSSEKYFFFWFYGQSVSTIIGVCRKIWP